ncbi:helix-turn-helix domain-containing protein [Spirosoma radiotolerans]|nr:helix-turn-helix transcriptional regulator [Spirosoma radiotolerans]
MRPLNQLTNGTLLALKTALDGYQRFEHSEPMIADYFGRILDSLIGPLTDINIWAIRNLINEEDRRRSNQVAIKPVNPKVYENVLKLSPPELRVLKLIGDGYRMEIIADLLNVSYRTVVNHKVNISAKLGLGSSRDLIKFAIDNLTIL